MNKQRKTPLLPGGSGRRHTLAFGMGEEVCLSSGKSLPPPQWRLDLALLPPPRGPEDRSHREGSCSRKKFRPPRSCALLAGPGHLLRAPLCVRGTGKRPLCRGHRVGFLLHSREHPSKRPVARHCTCLTDRETKVWRGETVSPSLESNGRQSQRPHLKRAGNSDAGVVRTASAVKGARRKGPSAVWFHSQGDLDGSDSQTESGGWAGAGPGCNGESLSLCEPLPTALEAGRGSWCSSQELGVAPRGCWKPGGRGADAWGVNRAGDTR